MITNTVYNKILEELGHHAETKKEVTNAEQAYAFAEVVRHRVDTNIFETPQITTHSGAKSFIAGNLRNYIPYLFDVLDALLLHPDDDAFKKVFNDYHDAESVGTLLAMLDEHVGVDYIVEIAQFVSMHKQGCSMLMRKVIESVEKSLKYINENSPPHLE